MNFKRLLLILSLVTVLVISGCAQSGKLKSDADKECASESIEVLDADGSKTPTADIENSKDKKNCFVQFEESDNLYVVFEGATVKSIFQDVNNDGLYYEEDNDINILNAVNEQEGENAASILNLYYNDQDVNPGKYDPKIPKGAKSKATVAGEDIGIGKGPVAKCGDGVLQAPEQCDPPGADCQSGSICQAGKCACVPLGSQSAQSTSAGTGSSASATTAPTSQPDSKTKTEPSADEAASATESSGKKISFSVSSKLATDTQLVTIKLTLPSKKSVSCSSQTFTVKKEAKNNFELSVTGTGDLSVDKTLADYTVGAAGAGRKIGEVALTAGSVESQITEAKLYSTTEKKSSTCKVSGLNIPSGETAIVQLTATAKALSTSSSAAEEPETLPVPSGSPLTAAKTSPVPSSAGAATSSPTPIPSGLSTLVSTSPTPTPTPTAQSATPTPTPTSSTGACPSGPFAPYPSVFPCTCGPRTYISSSEAPSGPSLYCCSGSYVGLVTSPCPAASSSATPTPTPSVQTCAGGDTPITTTCKCGFEIYNSGYCCASVWRGVPCSCTYSTPSGCTTQSMCGNMALQWCSNTGTCISMTSTCTTP